jgi:hypothetical protein
VRDVRPHEPRDGAGCDQPVHDEHHGRGIRVRTADRIEAVRRVDVEARRGKSRADRIAMVLGHVRRAVQHDAAGGRGIRRQGTADARKEPGGGGGVRSAEGLREGDERAVRDAALELPQDALLPRLRILEDRDRLRAELERGVGPPHRRKRGVESQHAPDPSARAVVHRRYPQTRGRSGGIGNLGRRRHRARSRQTGR